MRLFRLPAMLAVLTLPLAAQTATHGTAGPNRPVPAALMPYLSCRLPVGPAMVQSTLLPQAPMTRSAQTLTGPKEVRLSDGVFTAWSYPNTAPFANVKVELLPGATYRTEKADLISEFDSINARGEDTQRNYALKPTLNGFEIYGFDRTALDGKVLGIYLLFDNAHHVATTAYFLNAPADQRKFNTLADYENMRQEFLNAYTACVRKQLPGTAPAAHPAAKHKRTR
jgi:hypothetical protein